MNCIKQIAEKKSAKKMKPLLDVVKKWIIKITTSEMLDDINLPLRNLIKTLSQSAHMAIITES